MLYDDRCECFETILEKWSSLLRWRSLLGAKNPIVVATNGCFDILHAGHISFLKEAASLGTHLVVGLNGDQSVRNLKGEGRPIHSQNNRKTVLESIRYVSHVHIFDEDDCARFLIASKPNIYVKAGDYTIETLNPKERDILKELGTKIVFAKYIDGLSTTEAVRRLDV
jgi:rfaE bifunctional protein nucleotidyltransferase chain/domain